MTQDYNAVHAERFRRSMEWIGGLELPVYASILELGGQSEFTKLIRNRWPLATLHNFESDLRYAASDSHFSGRRSPEYDLVIAAEVLEHLSDTPILEAIPTEWAGSGMEQAMKTCERATRGGGWLFVSTPNAVSVTAIRHSLHLAPPCLYRPHVRELVPYELDDLLRKYGFNIVRRETLDVWRNAISPAEHKRISDFIASSGYPTDLRGEDIFALCRHL